MIRILLSGCSGRMGQAIVSRVKDCENMEIVAGVDSIRNIAEAFPVYEDFASVKETADIALDFSHVSLTSSLLAYCTQNKLPLVLCTTGIAGHLEEQVLFAAKEIPVFRSFNMSLGVSLMQALVRQAARVLGDVCDVEILEKHHNKKVDAPSGTAIMIAEAAASVLPYSPHYVYDRTGEHRQRDSHEIGIHSVRGGTIVGEHEAMFIGQHEILTISHSALSRELFASGAVKAAAFMMDGVQPGIYTMDDLVRALSSYDELRP